MNSEIAREALAEVSASFFQSSESRREKLFARLTDLCGELAPWVADDLLDAFDTLITVLANHVTAESRMALSYKLCHLERPPQNILHILAEDDFEIAAPILRYSPAIKEQHLVRIAQSGGERHLTAIAGRKIVSSHLCDIIISRGGSSTLIVLASNEGAYISEFGFELLLNKSANDLTLQVVLTKRKRAPGGLAKPLGLVAEIDISSDLDALSLEPSVMASRRRFGNA